MFAPRFLIRDGHELQFFFYMDRNLEEKSKSTIFRRLGDLIRDSNGIATRGGIDQECVHICLVQATASPAPQSVERIRSQS